VWVVLGTQSSRKESHLEEAHRFLLYLDCRWSNLENTDKRGAILRPESGKGKKTSREKETLVQITSGPKERKFKWSRIPIRPNIRED